jgi:hypothetical protein
MSSCMRPRARSRQHSRCFRRSPCPPCSRGSTCRTRFWAMPGSRRCAAPCVGTAPCGRSSRAGAACAAAAPRPSVTCSRGTRASALWGRCHGWRAGTVAAEGEGSRRLHVAALRLLMVLFAHARSFLLLCVFFSFLPTTMNRPATCLGDSQPRVELARRNGRAPRRARARARAQRIPDESGPAQQSDRSCGAVLAGGGPQGQRSAPLSRRALERGRHRRRRRAAQRAPDEQHVAHQRGRRGQRRGRGS